MSATGMALNDALVCRIETLAYGGDGLARVEGRVVFVPGTLAGETVRVRVVQVKPNFARAALCDVVEPSPLRIAPCCRVADGDTGELCQVPGCVYDHLDYAAELCAKQQQLEGFLRRLRGTSPLAFLPPFAAPSPLHYRNKMVLHAARTPRGLRLGYRREPSHSILDLPACPLACDALNAALGEFRQSRPFDALPPEADLTFRHTPHDGAVWWMGRAAPLTPCPDLLTEISPAGPLRVPRDGFYQVNPAVGDALVRTVAEWFGESSEWRELLDLYCGVGVFGFACMAAGGTRLTGIESGRDAVSAARLNAASLGVPAAFHCRALGQFNPRFSDVLGDPSHATAIVDPPREGMAADAVRSLADSGIARIFYVSCDPATLARDLALLTANARYRLVRARLFDMFPRTAHFETLVELCQK